MSVAPPLRSVLACILGLGLSPQDATGQDSKAVPRHEAPNDRTWLVVGGGRDRFGDPIRQAMRAACLRRDEAAFERHLSELCDYHAESLSRARAAVVARGGRVTRTSEVFGTLVVELTDAAAADLLEDEAVLALHRDAEHAGAIGIATNNLNHRVDFVQSTRADHRGAGTALALLDSGAAFPNGSAGLPHPAFDRPPGAHGTRLLLALSGSPDPNDIRDTFGHGTAVAGIALARDWDQSSVGDDAFAPHAEFVSVKITRGSASTYRDSDLLMALDAVAQRRLSHRLTVANLSWQGHPDPTHPVQQALDRLAVDFDCLVVTAAGNLGHTPNPAAASNGCTNAISVTAVHADSHLVWSPSTFGPLPGDPARTWPDLAAVGVGVRAPLFAFPLGDAPQTGTSFAAPMVAGTALVLRGQDPSLTALETAALLLGSAQSLESSNPSGSRYRYGMGLLRTDLAVEAMHHAQRVRGRATFAAPDRNVVIENPIAGSPHVATLVWHRQDTASNDFDDLDLIVLDPLGREIAVSRSPRNHYERVIFTPTQPGVHVLSVRGRALHVDGVDWALACHVGRGELRQDGTWVEFGTGCSGDGVDPARGTIYPAGTGQRFGNSHTSLPFGSRPCRVLQVLDGLNLPSGTRIDHIALRRDETSTALTSFDVDLEIHMGHTIRGGSNLTQRFDLMYDDQPVVVFARRTHRVIGTFRAPDSPRDFDVMLALDQPFIVDATNGRKPLLDFRVHGHSMGNQSFGLEFDAELGNGTVMLAAIGDPNAVLGQLDPIGLSVSLMSDARGRITPALSIDRPPRSGDLVALAVRNAPPGTIAALLCGLDATTWGSASLPYAWDPIAAPGCAILVRPDSVVSTLVQSTGIGCVEVRVPSTGLVIGREFHWQFLVLDHAANGTAISSSAAASSLVGR
ncbi:MAG: S8 family serine peptidase [Planctomycetota bacterium]